ncbi:unnamed protein product [Cuscuta epithymum]|uniref:Protein BPS1, chloroplastic n=1 Tax=Cuscuta epithymum TaxID=186058 RepID=A0AAV0EIT2_9ASTE|nr:unnamed protein product [Cuscuta epithymum]
MSRPQGPHRPFFPFGNPFRRILPNGSNMSQRLHSLLKSFEESLALKLKNLIPESIDGFISLSWFQKAIVTLSEIHGDTKELITALEFPVSDWDEKWIDVYLDNSVKLLDICTAFSSEITRINQSNLFLTCAVHYLDGGEEEKLPQACLSLQEWGPRISGQNPRLGRCFDILNRLTESLNLPKIKRSEKGKVLMRAMYGVRTATIFVCSVFAVSFSGCVEKLKELEISESCYLWADNYTHLQDLINKEIRKVYSSGNQGTALRELEDVRVSVEKLCPLIRDGGGGSSMFREETLGLAVAVGRLSEGLDGLAKEVDGFFQIVLTGRDALLCNLRVGDENGSPTQGNTINVERSTSR